MVYHYIKTAFRRLKTFDLNIMMGYLLVVSCQALAIIAMMHIFHGILPSNYKIVLGIVVIAIVFAILICCFNINTIQNQKRLKEWVVRKIVGAENQDLHFQVTVESVIRIVFLTMVSMALVDLITPILSHLTRYDVSLNKNFTPEILSLLALLNIMIAITANLNLLIQRKMVSKHFQHFFY